MGRIIRVGSGPPIPAQNTNMSFRMRKLTAPGERAVECQKSVAGLYWQTMSIEYIGGIGINSGPFDSVADITEYVESDAGVLRPVNFWFHAAKLVGELCDEEVTWEFVWPPGCSGPRAWKDGAYCVICPNMYETERVFGHLLEGTLSVTATVGRVEYGPLNLIIEEEPY